MKKFLIAIALTIALSAAAHAQTAPPAAPKAAPMAHAGHDMQSMKCKDMHGTMSGSGGQADHSKMDHSKMDHSKMAGCGDATKTAATPAVVDPHAKHQR